MASVTEKKRPARGPRQPAQELLVDEQISRTRRGLKWLDFTAGAITLVIGTLLYLLVASVLEHWVIPGGWSAAARTVLFVVLVAGICWYAWRTLWPLVSRPINPAYAAKVIEQSSPSLKNSLINLLLLRDRRLQMSQRVYQAIEHQAAQRLSEVPVNGVIDRSAIVRLGYVLVGVVALCGLYRVLSPKDLVASAERVLNPWSSTPVPSRVHILDVVPGDTSVARGERLDIAAEVIGIGDEETVSLRYSTLDEQTVEEQIPMQGSDNTKFECRLPDQFSQGVGGGIQQDLTYWIEAGDARSPDYRITVFARPTLIVQRIRYEYPSYTGMPPREEENTGNIHALEGTRVTLYSLANQPIRSAHVDFAADGRHDVKMSLDGEQATARFPLELRDDRRTPRWASYVLRFMTTTGRANVDPPKYAIDVIPDYSPEVHLPAPSEQLIEVQPKEQFVIEVEARDPDFALQTVAVLGEKSGEQILKENLLTTSQTGRFVGRLATTPQELGLKPGDVLDYWAVAADNRSPKPNIAQTARQQIRVIGPANGNGNQQQQPGQGDSPQQQEGSGQGENNGQQEGQPGGSNGQPSDQSQQQGETGSGGQQGTESDASDQPGSENSQGAGGDQPSGESSGESLDNQQRQSSQQEQQDPSSNGEPGQDQQGQPGQQNPVSPEGDDDARAFERIADHLREQDDRETDGRQAENQADSQQDETSGAGSRDDTRQAVDDQDASDGTPDADQSEQPGEEQPPDQADSQGIDGTAQQQISRQPGAEGKPNQQLPTEQSAADEQSLQESTEENQTPGGEMSPEQGSQGEGNNPGDDQGSPNPLGEKRPQDKPTDESADSQLNDQEPAAQGEGQQESDSAGGQAGDRSGGGQEGAGQQADDEGTGTAGENTAADAGGGQAAEPGTGEASGRAGEEQLSDGATGKSSEDQPGPGSQNSDSNGGEQPGGQQAGKTQPGKTQPDNAQPGSETPTTEGGADQPSQADPSDKPPGTNDESAGSASPQNLGGGTGGNSAGSPPPGETQPGDAANLEYARKQTDLVLERLEDQLREQEVDEDLLEKLGWSEDELRRFVQRWKNLKHAASGDDPAAEDAQLRLDNALRRLGLDPDRRTNFQSQVIKEKIRDLRDSYRARTPLEYAEQVRAYIKGTATTPEDE